MFHALNLSTAKAITNIMTMDSLPPNDPNQNGGHNNNGAHRSKEEALTPRASGTNENGDVEMFGDLQDNGFVVVMFLMSVAGWMLRERCVC
jgi:hypothetical protein